MKICVRKYQDSDYDQVKKWFELRDMAPVPKEFLSDCGYIVPCYAVCFLYYTNSAVAFMENLISNPHADKKNISDAIDAVIQACIVDAKNSGKTSLMYGMTGKASVARRMKRIGFRFLFKKEYSMVTFNLKELLRSLE